MKHFNLHAIINSAILIGVAVAGILYLSNEKKTLTYVDNIRLFNEFNMTKEIRYLEDRKINTKTKQLDSIYRILQAEKDQKGDRAQKLVKEMNLKNNELQDIRNNYQNNLSQNVWNRLNAYVSEYAEKNDIDMVFGTTGNGNVMFARDGIDITEAVLEFSNTRYEGQ